MGVWLAWIREETFLFSIDMGGWKRKGQFKREVNSLEGETAFVGRKLIVCK
jgi:hypothetical protein